MTASNERVVSLRSHRSGGRKLANPHYEAQLVGALLCEIETIKDCTELDPRHFSDELMRSVFHHVRAMREEGRRPTAITVAQSLERRVNDDIGGLDGLVALQQLGEQVRDAVGFLAREIRKLGELREIRDAAHDILTAIDDPDRDGEDVKADFLNRAEAIVRSGAPLLSGKREVAERTYTMIQEYEEPAQTSLLPLDRILGGGLHPRRLVTIAAPFGRGKTILCGSISDNLDAQGIKHLMISLETPIEDIELRHIARAAGANASQLTDPEEPFRESVLTNSRHYIDGLSDDTTFYRYMPGATLDDVIHTIMQAVYRHGIRGFILDYFQLIRGREKGQKQEQFYQEAADRLAAVARRENLFALVSAQVDEYGQIRDTNALNASSTTIVRMIREPEGPQLMFDVVKSNIGRWIKPQQDAAEHTVFDLAGPHFRDPGETDHGARTEEDEDPSSIPF